MKKLSERTEKGVWAAVAFVGFVAIWQLAVALNPESPFPGPITTIQKLIESCAVPLGRNTLPEHILFSLSRVMTGYLISGVLGIVFGLMLAELPAFRATVMPLFDILRAIPPIAWIPLAILWLGVGEIAKYFLIFIAGFAPFALNAYAGAVRVDPQLIGAARMLGAAKGQVFFKVILPATVPYMFSGAQIALSSCWMAVIAAEMLKSTEGVGWIITAASNYGNYLQVCVGMVSIALVGFVLVNAMQLLERKLLRWNVQGK